MGAIDQVKSMNQLVTGMRNENELIVALEGRVDSNNVSDMEQQIDVLLQKNSDCRLVLDFEQVNYVSSAGLRMIMKYYKAYEDMKLINVGTEVWEIFDMTGFLSFLNISKKKRKVSIENCEMIGRGTTGNVYRLDSDTIIKVYNKKTPLKNIERERESAQKIFLNGIPTAISYDVVHCEDNYGIIFELVNADTLSGVIRKNPDELEEYAMAFAKLVKQTHETHLNKEGFVSAKEIRNVYADDMGQWLEPQEVEKLHKLINCIPDRDTAIHGDFHENNVMLQNGELILIDMADVCYGHPIFDLAHMYFSHIIMGQMGADVMRSFMGIEPKQASYIWNKVLEVNFDTKDESALKSINNLLAGFALLTPALRPALAKNQTEQQNQMLVQSTRAHLLPIIDQLAAMDIPF